MGKKKQLTNGEPSQRYAFVPQERGFTIRRDDGAEVVVQLAYRDNDAIYFWKVLRRDSNAVEANNVRVDDRYWNYTGVWLYNVKALVQTVTETFYVGWQPTGWREGFNPWAWAKNQTGKALAKRVTALWREYLPLVPADYLEVARAMQVNCFSLPYDCLPGILVRDRFIRADLLRYRAACCALRDFNATNGFAYGDSGDVQEPLIRFMRRWRDQYSDTGSSYRALNVTLDSAPAGMAANIFRDLRHIHLERPITSKLELTALLSLVDTGARGRYQRIFMHARHDDLVRAMRIVGRYLHKTYNPRSTEDILDFMQLLRDYPEAHAGGVVSLAERCVEWHRAEAERRIEADYAYYADTTPLALPPVPLPQIEGIRFLATTGDARSEGLTMGHCIGGYARKAIEGNCYLFHADYQGEMASAEVAPDGRVVQSRGPHNQANRAATWLEKQLSRWGRQFPERGIPDSRMLGEIEFQFDPQIEYGPPVVFNAHDGLEQQPQYAFDFDEIPF